MDNNRYSELFPDEATKAAAFDKIAKLFYSKNFSASSKSEVDLLMFSIYMDALINNCKKSDGTIDYSICSDYEIGKQLGITQERVRSLKVKKQARYPVEFRWQDSLLSIRDSVRYDDGINKIIIPTRDPNLYNEIRNYIEDHGGYIEIKRSGNYIRIRPEHYFMLVYEELSEADQNTCRKEIEKELRKHNKGNEIPEARSPKDVIKNVANIAKYGLNVFSAIESASGNPLWIILKAIIENA